MCRTAVWEGRSDRVFLAAAGLLFAISAAVTVAWCGSMSMEGMPMPGGWTMSMAWMRMPGQSWIGAAGSFAAMWVVMMVAMMLPSLVPMLRRYRDALAPPGEARLGGLTARAGIAYFAVWTGFGLAVYPVGVALAAAAMRHAGLARAVPFGAGAAVLLAGLIQLTAWKARCLATCREKPGCGRALPADAATAWRHGARLALHCGRCCANLIAILLVLGVMDVGAMAAVTAAITAERVAPRGERAARVVGVVAIVAAVILLARAG